MKSPPTWRLRDILLINLEVIAIHSTTKNATYCSQNQGAALLLDGDGKGCRSELDIPVIISQQWNLSLVLYSLIN